MSGEILELIIFAGIAIFLVNKLFSILGTIDEDDPMKKKTVFGEPGGNVLKDVSNTLKKDLTAFINGDKVTEYIAVEDRLEILSKLEDVKNKMPNFNIMDFVNGAEKAFAWIIKAVQKNDSETLDKLLDSRFSEKIIAFKNSYEKVDPESLEKFLISGVSIFGNNISIKMLFTFEKDRKEEWTFIKNALNGDRIWHLSNIELEE